ncbi:hypothetical protein K0M31_014772 [Melipona bicolor]|uniref:Uncharacterized protein n=1 Tax=Melipona bicolor TaxID=60889 RepID=A0AA40FH68_9HYME|nr:hypothetical protein K0M31_014772 [Melipona bicolor]
MRVEDKEGRDATRRDDAPATKRRNGVKRLPGIREMPPGDEEERGAKAEIKGRGKGGNDAVAVSREDGGERRGEEREREGNRDDVPAGFIEETPESSRGGISWPLKRSAVLFASAEAT